MQAFLFAPDDVPQLLANPKNNLFGIGYSGLEKPAMFGGGGHINLFEDPSQPARPSRPQVQSSLTPLPLFVQLFFVPACIMCFTLRL